MSPVYWKPRYPTRSMRERAWAKRSVTREQALARTRPKTSWWQRLRKRLRGAAPERTS